MKFPQKLWQLVNDCESGAIGWGKEDDVIFIDQEKFEREILSNYGSVFKTQSFDSFIRQLNLYGFRKCIRNKDVHEFKHPFFVRGKEELLTNLRRKYTYDPYSKTPKRKSATQKHAQAQHRRSSSTDHTYPDRFNSQATTSYGCSSSLHLLNAMAAGNSPWFGSSKAANVVFGNKPLRKEPVELGNLKKDVSEQGTIVQNPGCSNCSPSTSNKEDQPLEGNQHCPEHSGNINFKKKHENNQSNEFWINPAIPRNVVFVPVPVPADYGFFPGFYTDTLDSMFDRMNKITGR